MDTIKDQLSSELQELYLTNKEWLADILFLEDETRFFQKLFDNVISLVNNEKDRKEIQYVNISLNHLKKRREDLKLVILNHQHFLAIVLKDIDRPIGLEFLENNTLITKEIKSLFVEEKLVRQDLYVLVEAVMDKQNMAHLLVS